MPRTTGLRNEPGKYLGGFMRFYPGLGGVATLSQFLLALLGLTWPYLGLLSLASSVLGWTGVQEAAPERRTQVKRDNERQSLYE